MDELRRVVRRKNLGPIKSDFLDMRGGNISPPAPASLRRHALSEQLAGRQAINSAKDKEVLSEMVGDVVFHWIFHWTNLIPAGTTESLDKTALEEMGKLEIPENPISEISRQRAWTKFGLVDACLPRYELEISS
jgi:hypothetical protein